MLKLRQKVVYKSWDGFKARLNEGVIIDTYFYKPLNKDMFVVESALGNTARLTYEEIQYIEK